jgi:hypothetical protein
MASSAAAGIFACCLVVLPPVKFVEGHVLRTVSNEGSMNKKVAGIVVNNLIWLFGSSKWEVLCDINE